RLAVHFQGKRDFPGAVRAHLAAAEAYLQRGEIARARQHGEAALALEPEQSEALALLARLEAQEQGKPPTSEGVREAFSPFFSQPSRDPLFNALAESPGRVAPEERDPVGGREIVNEALMGRTGNSMAKKGTAPTQGAARGGGNPGRGNPADQGGRKR